MGSTRRLRLLAGLSLLFAQAVATTHSSAQESDRPAVTAQATAANSRDMAGDAACRACHSEKSASYLSTAHHLTSKPPTKESILGSFADGKSVLKTSNQFLYFRMESKADAFYQTAVWEIPPASTTRSEKMDVVIGSGRRGQTYLYWKQDHLFQLPVSYWTSLSTWINSPNYQDGEANFEKRVLPNCLGCHLNHATAIGSPIFSNQFKRESLEFGISCERCHGPGRQHVEAMTAKKSDATIVNPGKLSRDRQVDLCAQCHGGLRPPLADPFSYVPGEPLDKYYRSNSSSAATTADVHGNQVALLQMSRCYKSSPDMSCSTCHDIHQTQRDASAVSQRCLKCHRVESCGKFPALQEKLIGTCANCHMPVQASNVIVSSLAGKQTKEMVRSHWIKVYPEMKDTVAPAAK